MFAFLSFRIKSFLAGLRRSFDAPSSKAPAPSVSAHTCDGSLLLTVAEKWPNITLMLDVSSLSSKQAEQVAQLIEGEIQNDQQRSSEEQMYVLCAWEPPSPSLSFVYCIYAWIGAVHMRVTLREYSRPDVRTKRLSWDTTPTAFDACSFAEYEYYMPKWENDVRKDPDEHALKAYQAALASSWECLLRLRPCHREQRPVYTAKFDLPFDDLCLAQKYWRTKLIYKLFEPTEGSMRLQTWIVTAPKIGTASKRIWKIDELSDHLASPDDFTQRIQSVFDSDRWHILCEVCSRVIYIDDQSAIKHMNRIDYSEDFRELHVCAPKNQNGDAELSYKIFTFYTGSPFGVPGMSGHTYAQTITIPQEQMTWSDDRLWKEYGPGFEAARKSPSKAASKPSQETPISYAQEQQPAISKDPLDKMRSILIAELKGILIARLRNMLYDKEWGRWWQTFPYADAWRYPANIADSMACVGAGLYQFDPHAYREKINRMSSAEIMKLAKKEGLL